MPVWNVCHLLPPPGSQAGVAAQRTGAVDPPWRWPFGWSTDQPVAGASDCVGAPPPGSPRLTGPPGGRGGSFLLGCSRHPWRSHSHCCPEPITGSFGLGI